MTLTERKQRLIDTLKRFPSARIMVVGDVMADHYIWGEVERISPEAPVPVVHVRREETLLGGAANVVSNLAALDARVELCSLVGLDAYGELIHEELRMHKVPTDGLIVNKKRKTILKTRVIAHGQQVVRVDWEDTTPIGSRLTRQLLAHIESRAGDLDAVIISDYGKGVINKALLDGLRTLMKTHNMIVAVDPKIQNMRHYHGFTTMTPNHHESGQALGLKLNNVDKEIHGAGRQILKRYRLQSLVITRGEEGMSLFENGAHVMDIPTVAKEVYDVTGAGDTVISALTCGLAVGAMLHEAATIANFAAGIVIAEVGTASAPRTEVINVIRKAKDLK